MIPSTFSCDWSGTQKDIDDHFKTNHSDLGDMFKHNAHGYVPFNGHQNIGTLNLIDAFSRRFVFYYHTDCTESMVYFCVFLIGSPDEAMRYSIHFELHGGPNNPEKVNQRQMEKVDFEIKNDFLPLI